jgi:hypothetical protein
VGGGEGGGGGEGDGFEMGYPLSNLLPPPLVKQ